MLIRISLIIAILAGLGVGALNFVKVKEKITTLQENWQKESDLHKKFEKDYNDTRRSLTETNRVLVQTQTLLASTTEERDTAVKKAETESKRADDLSKQLATTTAERNEAQADLAAYKATSYTPPQILAMAKEYKGLETMLEEVRGVKATQDRLIVKLENRLEKYENPNKPVRLPAALAGKVIVADPKWNFVVLNVGGDQGVVERGELLVNRNGKLVAKVIVSSVQKDRSIANVIPGWELGEVIEGDQVIPAHPSES